VIDWKDSTETTYSVLMGTCYSYSFTKSLFFETNLANFDFMLPSELLVKRKSNFLRKFNSCSSIVCYFGFAKCVKCV